MSAQELLDQLKAEYDQVRAEREAAAAREQAGGE